MATTEEIAINLTIKTAKSAKTLKELAKSTEDLASSLEGIGKDDKNFKKLNKAFEQTNANFNELLITADKTKLTFGELELAQENLLKELKNTDRGSDKFRILQQEIVEVNKEIGNTELGLVGLNSEDVAGAFGQLSGAVGTITSSFVLLGGEGNRTMEEIGANIEKAIGISQAFNGAVEGITAGTKLLKNYNKAIKSTAIGTKVMAVAQGVLNFVMNLNPVVAIVSAFLALVAVFAVFSANTNKAAQESERLNKKLADQKDAYEELSKTLDDLDTARQTELSNQAKLLSSQADLIKSKGDLTDADKKNLKAIEDAIDQTELSGLDSTIETSATKLSEFGDVIATSFEEIGSTISATDWEDGINNINYDSLENKNKVLANDLKNTLNKGFTPENVDEQIKKIRELSKEQTAFTKTLKANSKDLGSAELEIFQATEEQSANLKTLLGDLTAEATNYKNSLADKDLVVQVNAIGKEIKSNEEIAKEREKAQERRDKRREEQQAKKEAEAEAEKQRLLDLEDLKEELFQSSLASDEERNVRRLTLELEANILRAETLIKDEEVLADALVQIKANAFKQIKAIEDEEIKLSKEKAQAIINSNQTTTDALLVLEQQQAIANAESIDDEVEREKAKNKAILNLSKIQITQIQNQADIELQNKELTEKQRLEIVRKTELAITQIKNEELNKQRDITNQALEEEQDVREQLIEAGFQALQSISDTAFELASINRQEQTESQLEALDERYSAENDKLRLQLANGQITQRKFDRESVKLEAKKLKEEETLKKKAFQKDKDAKIAQAVINGALAITQSFAQLGPIAGAIAAALTAVTTALQIAVISKSKYARGGVLQGPSHSQGGIQTPFGEVEGGEAIINKRSTELFRTELSAINQAGGGVAFAQGGVLGTSSQTVESDSKLDGTLRRLEETLRRPMKAFIPETDLSNSLNRSAEIDRNSTL